MFFYFVEIDVPGVIKVPGLDFSNQLERLIPLLNSSPCKSVCFVVTALSVLIRFHPVFSVLRLSRDLQLYPGQFFDDAEHSAVIQLPHAELQHGVE
jgi:hypothetical protein